MVDVMSLLEFAHAAYGSFLFKLNYNVCALFIYKEISFEFPVVMGKTFKEPVYSGVHRSAHTLLMNRIFFSFKC